MENNFKNSIVEALIMASPEPLASKKISEMIEDLGPSKVSKAVAELNTRYMEMGCAYRIREIAGGYQFFIMPEYTGYVEEMFSRRRKMRLTRAALETLAIIAYKQPATKTEIEQIRGVASDGVLHNLLEKNMVTIKGRASTVGKPLQYGTTDEFLKFFGLNKVEDLPKMSEIEELVATVDSQNQTELLLESEYEDGEMNVKLNIADGTYTPAVRAEADDDGEEAMLTNINDDIMQESNNPEEDSLTHTSESDEDTEESGVIIDMEKPD